MNISRAQKKYIFAAAAAVLLLFVIFSLVRRDSGYQQEYIFDKSHNVRLEDIKKYFQKIDFTDGIVREYFSKKTANPYTVQFFHSLQKRFDAPTFEEHFEAVRQYLHSVMDPAEAEQLLALYRKYSDYQKDLNKKIQGWGMPQTPEDALKFLANMQEHRREFFGPETADSLFGAEIKSKEYPIRRGIIVNDGKLYAADKLDQIKKLNKDMWGDEADSVDGYEKPYTKYKELFTIYEKDFGEMSAGQKKEKVDEFRKNIFTPDVIERLNEVDELLAKEDAQENTYRAEEEKIAGNPNLNEAQKNDMLKEVQDKIFGEEADAFRRREAIRKGMEKN